MPDLPLPKPQPPLSATSTPPDSHGDSTPPRPEPISAPSSASTPFSPSTPITPITPITPSPLGASISPQTTPPTRPPAVVTALSSVSSNTLPKTIVDDKVSSTPVAEVAGMNVSSTPTSAPSVLPPMALGEKAQAGSTQARGGASSSQGTTAAFAQPIPQVDGSSVLPSASPAEPPPATLQVSALQTSSLKTAPSVSPTTTSSPIVSQFGGSTAVSPAGMGTGIPLSTPPTPTPSTSTSPTSTLPTPPPSGAPAPPPIAKPKKSRIKTILLILGAIVGLAVIVGVVFAVLNRPKTSSVDQGSDTPSQPSGQGSGGSDQGDGAAAVESTLEYWGLWESGDAMNSILSDFQTANPSIAVRYVQQSHRDYRERLQNAIVSGNGPDVFRYHASWVPMLSADLEPLPESVMNPSEYAQTFYPAASRQLQVDGQLVGIPLMYEGLVLYYNQDILETAGVQPPTSWSELRDAARTLTIAQPSGQLQRGGAAIGTADNVEHFADILAVLMLQNGADLENPNSPEGRDALLFYTNFVKQDKVWSSDMPASTTAFARGDVAMMFAPSWRAFDIAQMNPNLRFAAVPLPQLPNNKVTWASYWAEGVSQKSQQKEAAWKLLQYLSTAEVQQKLHSAQSQTRAFGEPYSRVDLADQLATNKVVGPLLQDAPTAEGWYMSSFTHDNGINDQIIQYYTDAVNSLLDGTDITQVLTALQQGVNQVLATYGVAEALAPTEAPQQY